MYVYPQLMDQFPTFLASKPPEMGISKEEKASIALLMLLYILQGIPLGLIASVPMLLQNHHLSYTAQAHFSFAYWPFSLKLLFAPIIDALYVKSMGRRKSWLIPTQLALGVGMLYLGSLGTDQTLGQSGVVPWFLGEHGPFVHPH